MDSATHYLSKRVYFNIYHSKNSKVTVVNRFQKFRVDTPLNTLFCGVIWNDLVDINWKQHLSLSSTATRGHSSRFQLRRCNTDTYLQSFFPRTAKDWNHLPTNPATPCPSMNSNLHCKTCCVNHLIIKLYICCIIWEAVPTDPLCVQLVVSYYRLSM